jgi:hypothetical protein
MKRWIIAVAAWLCLVQPGLAQTAPKSDVRTFELVPVAPPTPVLKYELLYRWGDRRPGNAAIQYMTATELMNDAYIKKIDDAGDAYDRKQSNFEALAAALDRPNIYALLELGGRCETCDWQLPLREQGAQAMLPYLGQLLHLARTLECRAVLQARGGNTQQALETVRVGYELSRKVANCPILISGLVGVRISVMASDALAEVMNRPESPNLYWALASLPRPFLRLADNIEAEGAAYAGASIPELGTKRLDSLSAEEWRRIFKQFVEFGTASPPPAPLEAQPWNDERAIAEEITRDLPKAQEDYAQRYGLSADQVAHLDGFKVVCTFWYQQWLNWTEEARAVVSMPYPQIIARFRESTEKYQRMQKDEPANAFLMWVGSFDRAATTYARGDRLRAALADVEAIRSYAAAHDGALPANLQDITDTPALENPLTGRAFEYRVDGENATLSDSQAEYPLSYTIRIRK